MSIEGRRLGLLVLGLAALVLIAAGSTVAPGTSGAQSGSMLNCPAAGQVVDRRVGRRRRRNGRRRPRLLWR